MCDLALCLVDGARAKLDAFNPNHKRSDRQPYAA